MHGLTYRATKEWMLRGQNHRLSGHYGLGLLIAQRSHKHRPCRHFVGREVGLHLPLGHIALMAAGHGWRIVAADGAMAAAAPASVRARSMKSAGYMGSAGSTKGIVGKHSRHRKFIYRILRQRHPYRVADTFGEKRGYPYG